MATPPNPVPPNPVPPNPPVTRRGPSPAAVGNVLVAGAGPRLHRHRHPPRRGGRRPSTSSTSARPPPRSARASPCRATRCASCARSACGTRLRRTDTPSAAWGCARPTRPGRCSPRCPTRAAAAPTSRPPAACPGLRARPHPARPGGAGGRQDPARHLVHGAAPGRRRRRQEHRTEPSKGDRSNITYCYVDDLEDPEKGWLNSKEAQGGVVSGEPEKWAQQWAEETHAKAQDIWKMTPQAPQPAEAMSTALKNTVLDDQYLKDAMNIINRQLGIAGLRLAAFLNKAYASCPAP